MTWLKRFGIAAATLMILALGAAWLEGGSYALHVLWRHGGTYWVTVPADSPRISASMRLALASSPRAQPGTFEWQAVAPGFETADLPALVAGAAVDHLMLARIDPRRFRFVVRNASDGDKGLDQWMAALGAVLVVNGSYFNVHGKPDTPFLSDGVALGPSVYDAKAGAFVASDAFAGVRDLAAQDWQAAFRGADDAMVSYPLLIADGAAHVGKQSRWLANRSFVGQDSAGRVIIGTTTDAFFSLYRLAGFLEAAPLDLVIALNLDGGPVANQGISLNGYDRRVYGRWEVQAPDAGDQVELLTWPYGNVAMPVVLAVFPR